MAGEGLRVGPRADGPVMQFRTVQLRTEQRMEHLLTSWQDLRDGRAVFLGTYALMTRAMVSQLEDGRFEDRAWVTELLDRFAGRYFDALDGFEAGRKDTPPVWADAHRAAVSGAAPPHRLLLAGVNAHINYDLVLTVAGLLAGSGGDPELRRGDYERVNDVIGATADAVQDEVLERWVPWTAPVDRWLGRVDEWAAVRLLTSWRSAVWDQAVGLMQLPPVAQERVVVSLSQRCCRRGRRILGVSGGAS